MFITLTDSHDTGLCYINTDQITSFFDCSDGGAKIYDTVEGNSYEVKESPEQILALIEAERLKALRDEFARNETLADVVDSCPHSECMDVLAGRPEPNGAVEFLQWEADWRAALKYIRADAMIRAREGK